MKINGRNQSAQIVELMFEKVIICMLRDTLHEDNQMIKDIPEIHKRVMNTSENKVVIDFLLFCHPA